MKSLGSYVIRVVEDKSCNCLLLHTNSIKIRPGTVDVGVGKAGGGHVAGEVAWEKTELWLPGKSAAALDKVGSIGHA